MPSSPDQIPSTKTLESETVLVLDSDPELRQFLAELLSPAGFRVVQVGRERELFMMLGSLRPSLIVLDFGLLEVSGADLIALLRRNDEWRPVRIVVTSCQAPLPRKPTLN